MIQVLTRGRTKTWFAASRSALLATPAQLPDFALQHVRAWDGQDDRPFYIEISPDARGELIAETGRDPSGQRSPVIEQVGDSEITGKTVMLSTLFSGGYGECYG
jgi:hypothetical protein